MGRGMAVSRLHQAGLGSEPLLGCGSAGLPSVVHQDENGKTKPLSKGSVFPLIGVLSLTPGHFFRIN